MKTKITNYLENTSKHLFADDTSLYKIYTTGNTVRILKWIKIIS